MGKHRRYKQKVDEFKYLLDFVNNKLDPKRWNEQLVESMGKEKLCWVRYKTKEGTAKEQIPQADIYHEVSSRIGLGWFFRSEDLSEVETKLKSAILEVKPYLPKICNSKSTYEGTKKLQRNLRTILLEMAKMKFENYIDVTNMLQKIVRMANYSLEREAVISPDGSVHLTDEGEDAGKTLYFKLANLLHEIANNGKSYKGWVEIKLHGIQVCEQPKIRKYYKLKICICGCSQFFLQENYREKKFISDKHRLGYHNRQYASTGKMTEYMRKWRKAHPEVKKKSYYY